MLNKSISLGQVLFCCNEVSEYIEILEENVPHPAPSDLIFLNDEDLSPEEVGEIALAFYLEHD